MSNPTNTPDTKPVITIADPTETDAAPVEKQSFVRKTLAAVRTHKRPVLATAGLVGLTAVSAFVGRKTAPSQDGVVLELGPVAVVEGEVLEAVTENDTETA